VEHAQASEVDVRHYISMLDREVATWPGLACGIVRRPGEGVVLNVVRIGSALNSVEIACRRVDGIDWYAWASDGELIGAVDFVEDVAAAIARVLTERAEA
jgi:hypothetical protein